MAEMVFQYDIKGPKPGADIDAMITHLRDTLPEGFRLMEKIDRKKLFFGIEAIVAQYVCDAADGTLGPPGDPSLALTFSASN